MTTQTDHVASSGSAQLQRAADNLQTMTVREMAIASNTAKLLQRAGPQWIKDATEGQIVAFTRVAAYLGLNPLIGEIYLMHGGIYVSLAGRLKLFERTGEFDGISEARMLSKEQEQVHGVKAGDIARLVEVWRKGRRMPAIGVGIVTAKEYAKAAGSTDRDGIPFTPLGRNPEFMATKRAKVAALREAAPDLDVAVLDLEERGVRGYVATTLEGEVLDSYDDSEPLRELAVPSRAVANEAAPPPTVEGTVADPATGEVATDETAPSLAGQVAEAMQTILGDAATADAVVGGVGDWLAMYADSEGAAEAIKIAEAVAAELEAGAPTVAMAVDKVHRQRAESGQPFNVDLIIDPAAVPEAAAETAPAARGRRVTQSGLGV